MPATTMFFFKYLDLSIEKLNNKLAKADKKYELNYLLGKAFMFKAMALSTAEKNLDAFWATKSSIGYFEDVLEENPNFHDANLGIGVFQYALGFVPSVFKWALNLTGLTADQNKGFHNIKIALKNGTDSKTEASFHLGKIYSDYFAEYDSSTINLYNIINKYPKNTLFLYQCAITHLLNRDLQNAEKLLNRVISLNNKNFKQTTAFAYFLKGDIYFRKNNYEKAIEYYNKFTQLTRTTDYLGIASYRSAFCYEMLGKKDESVKCLSGINSGNDDIQEDIYAMEEGKKVKNYGWSFERLNLLTNQNNLEAAKYDSVISNLKKHLSSYKDEDSKFIGYLYLAESFIQKKEMDDANYYLTKVYPKKFDREKWGIPYFNYLKALYFYKIKKTNDAVKYINLAEDTNEYSFKEKYQPLINNLKRKLKID